MGDLFSAISLPNTLKMHTLFFNTPSAMCKFFVVASYCLYSAYRNNRADNLKPVLFFNNVANCFYGTHKLLCIFYFAFCSICFSISVINLNFNSSYTVHIKFCTDTTRAHNLEVLLYRN